MIRKKLDCLEWLEFELLSECRKLAHGVFLRHGGVSSGPYESLNFSTHQGDAEANVNQNRQKALNALKIPFWAQPWDVHGKDVEEVTSPSWQAKKPCDALLTEQKEIALLAKHADCQAAIIYDPIKEKLAVVHCGWRGNVQNIYGEAIRRMHELYGCLPQNLLVGISPSLGPEAAEFIHYTEELPKSFWDFQVRPFYFDLWAISRWQLENSGVLPHHIQIAQICTYKQESDFFSYRRLKKSGRHATMAALRF